jgi:uncharacterized repeat protein (TIGR01451 family)
MRKPVLFSVLMALITITALWVARPTAQMLTMTVTISRVVELNCGEGDGEACPDDFYPKMEIGGQGLDDGKERFCCAHGTDFEPNWVFSRSVNISAPIPVHIELYDQDDLTADDLLDIANNDPRPLDITVDANTCTWQGGGLSGFLNTQSSSQGSGSDSAKIYFFITIPTVSCTDTDGDGLLDRWETSGFDANNDGSIDVDLPAMGAKPRRKDVFLEIDYLVAGDHSHGPDHGAVRQVVEAFANAPVANPDGTTGIQLHVDVGTLYGEEPPDIYTSPGGVTGTWGNHGGGGNQIPEAGNTTIAFDNTGIAATGFFTLKNLDPVRNNIFRYGLFGHQSRTKDDTDPCLGGMAGVPSTNLMVTLAGVDGGGKPCWGTLDGKPVGSRDSQAGSLMHELGHTLGLQHGGADDVNLKPNYLSVMNYAFNKCDVPKDFNVRPPGLPGGCDFSRFALPGPRMGLNENSLDECVGLDNGVLGWEAEDWNGDDKISGVTCKPPNATTNVVANINGDTSDDGNKNGIQDPGEPPILGTLNGFEDWNALFYNFRALTDFTTATRRTPPQEPTPQRIESARAYLRSLLAPTLTVDKTGPTGARPGDTLAYNVRVGNSGRGPALEVALTDTKPDATTQDVTLGRVVLGKTIDTAFSYHVPCSTADGTVLTNTVHVIGHNILSEPVTGSDSVQTTIHAPVLELSKTASATVNAGEAITYTISYENTGSAAAANVVITDTLPAGIYYSKALDQGTGPLPTSVTVNADGTRTLVWTIGALPGPSGARTIAFTARPTLLALGGTTFTNNVTLAFKNDTGCVYEALRASATTTISVLAPSGDAEGLGFWRNHPEFRAAELLARIQATDQRYDGRNGSAANGALSAAEVAASTVPGGNMTYILEEQLLATYFNLATRRINAGTVIKSRTASPLGLDHVAEAALYAIATLKLPVNAANRPRYSNVTTVLDEINRNKSEVY